MRQRLAAVLALTLAAGAAFTGTAAAAPVNTQQGTAYTAPAVAPPDEEGTPPYLGDPKFTKGEPIRGGRPATTRQSGARMLAPADPSYIWWYGGGGQTGLVANEGAFAGMPVNNMYKHADEYHTHVQIAVIDNTSVLGGGRNIVEIGYGKTLAGCGQIVNPCIWVYHWVNGVQQGWNTGWLDYAASSLNAGDVVTGTTETAGCTSSASARNLRVGLRLNTTTKSWMGWADLCYGDATAGQFIGEFDDARWTDIGEDMPSADEVQVFGEVATLYSPSTDPDQDGYTCTDMGTGYLATSANGAYPGAGQRIADVTYPTSANSAVNLTPFNRPGDSYFGANSNGVYESHAINDATLNPPGNVRYLNVGGPGHSGVQGNTTPGVQGGC